MYATCLFCHASLGANESIEHFPLGNRLAFDAAKGRLWVVCLKCERWNLSPLDERWEAIEEAERAYRDTKKRVATDNVGLARLRDGTDLIRIGAPLRPEFAAWRYGDTFGKRRRKNLLIGTATVLGGGALIGGVGAGIFAAGNALGGAFTGTMVTLSVATQVAVRGLIRWTERPSQLTVFGNDGDVISLSPMSISAAVVAFQQKSFDDPVGISLTVLDSDLSKPFKVMLGTDKHGVVHRAEHRMVEINGAAGEQAIAAILAKTSGAAGSASEVAAAVGMVERAATHLGFLNALTGDERRGSSTLMEKRVAKRMSMRQMAWGPGILRLTRLAPSIRLALEMTLHEDAERRALEGELHELERRWKEAEEIAAISDSMFLPDQNSNSEQK